MDKSMVAHFSLPFANGLFFYTVLENTLGTGAESRQEVSDISLVYGQSKEKIQQNILWWLHRHFETITHRIQW